jgi:hypothetical protein
MKHAGEARRQLWTGWLSLLFVVLAGLAAGCSDTEQQPAHGHGQKKSPPAPQQPPW